jgi:enoyl-CoA hydratase
VTSPGNEVEVNIEDGVATLVLQAPQRRNALTPAMAREMAAACEAIDADPTVGATVVVGSGGSFCAGADRSTLAEAGNDPAHEDSYRDLDSVYQAFGRVGRLTMPTIAAVRGAAVGAGVNLLLATDLRIVANDARIIPGFARIGLHPGGGHFTLLNRIAGREAAAAIGLFGQEVSGQRAAEVGLAWEALPDDQVEDRARELAAIVAGDPALARRATRSFRTELGPPGVSWEAALDLERGPQMWSLRRRET